MTLRSVKQDAYTFTWIKPTLTSATIPSTSDTITIVGTNMGSPWAGWAVGYVNMSASLGLAPQTRALYPSMLPSCRLTHVAGINFQLECVPPELLGGFKWNLTYNFTGRVASLPFNAPLGFPPPVLTQSFAVTTQGQTVAASQAVVGSTVVMRGTGFYNGGNFFLGGIRMPLLTIGTTQVEFVLPNGDGKSLDGRIVVLDQHFDVILRITYPTPVISSITYPPGGCSTLGCSFTVTGQHFGYKGGVVPFGGDVPVPTGQVYRLGIAKIGHNDGCNSVPQILGKGASCISINATITQHSTVSMVADIPLG